MLEQLKRLKSIDDLHVGFVGGSDLSKQIEQLGEENFGLFDWRFSENGLLGYFNGEKIHSQSFVDTLGGRTFSKTNQHLSCSHVHLKNS